MSKKSKADSDGVEREATTITEKEVGKVEDILSPGTGLASAEPAIGEEDAKRDNDSSEFVHRPITSTDILNAYQQLVHDHGSAHAGAQAMKYILAVL